MKYALIILMLSSVANANCRYWGKCLEEEVTCKSSQPYVTFANVHAQEILTAPAKDIYICTSPYGDMYEQVYPGTVMDNISLARPHGMSQRPVSVDDVDPILVQELKEEVKEACLTRKSQLEAQHPVCQF